MLQSCIVSSDIEMQDVFEINERNGKDSYHFKVRSR